MNKNLITRLIAGAVCLMPFCHVSSSAQTKSVAVTNLKRAIAILDSTYTKCFSGNSSDLKMYDTYDLTARKGNGTADVWPYTAAMEATNSVLEALDALKDDDPNLYAQYHDKYVSQLKDLLNNLEYYRGTYTLHSYASVRTWSIYGVHRASTKDNATVTGIENVYDDQMWLVRELMRAYKLTSYRSFLLKARYLADYVIDGWDCVRDANGDEYGGITWGPGYNSKHSCSNGPIIQPLVWLYEQYAKPTETADYTYYYCDESNNRVTSKRKRSEVYLEFAKKIYAYQKSHLLMPSGVYWDMMGSKSNKFEYDTIGTNIFRAHVDVNEPNGTAYTYNSGSMLSGAAELYRITGEESYLTDIKDLSAATWKQFATVGKRSNGVLHYQFPVDDTATNGFNTWFDNVLMRAYWDACKYDDTYPVKALDSFQYILDYGYDNYLTQGMLPINLFKGWNGETVTKGFHQLAFAAEYAVLAKWQKQLATGIVSAEVKTNHDKMDVYSINGIMVRSQAPTDTAVSGLPHGAYIVNKKKVIL